MDAPRLHDLPDEWAETLATALVNGRCSRPVETAGGFLVRCGSRRVAVCPSCAEMVRGDWATIARSGVFDPPAGKRFRFYLLTLTAPSFGSAHAIPNAAKGHEARRCRCGARHTEADAALSGVPVDPDAYDYAGTVAFNYGFGRLWNNTKTRLRDAWESLAFFAVREWQDRGVLHLHAIIRIDACEAGPPSLVESRAKSATARNPLDSSVLRWGVQSKCDPLATDGDGGGRSGTSRRWSGTRTKTSASSTANGCPPNGWRIWHDLARRRGRFDAMRCGRIGPGTCMSATVRAARQSCMRTTGRGGTSSLILGRPASGRGGASRASLVARNGRNGWRG